MRRILALALSVVAAGAMPAGNSPLWGEQGERLDRERLPDFSYAGYHRGEAPIPEIAQATSVKDFGAVGDGVADDTAAIKQAIDATKAGAVFLPAGTYKITDFIWIGKPGVVLRGAGPERTILWFPRGLDEIHPREMHESRGLPTSGYSFDGAFVTIIGKYGNRPLAKIAAVAPRGGRSVSVDDASRLKVGQWLLVHAHEDAGQSLKTYLYSGDPGDVSHGKPLDTKMLVRVVAIEGTRVTLDRPLRFETRAAWDCALESFEPTVSECGIEEIGFKFPAIKYRGHFHENGANAIELRNVANCWVRNVHLHNADFGVNIVACQNTVDGVVITADAARAENEPGNVACSGHHAFQCKEAEDNFITHFDIRTCYIHDLSVEHASGNVYADGHGQNLCFDHHKDTPYENLYTALDCGEGTRVWVCGGGAGLGRQCAGYGTFWGISAKRPVKAPPAGWGPATMVFAPEAEPRDLRAAQAEVRQRK